MIDRNSLTYRESTTAVVTNNDGKIILVQKASYKDNEWDTPVEKAIKLLEEFKLANL